MGLEITPTSLTTNRNTSNKVELSMNKMSRKTISVMGTINHKHRMKLVNKR